MPVYIPKTLIIFTLLIIVSACGGGGGDVSSGPEPCVLGKAILDSCTLAP